MENSYAKRWLTGLILAAVIFGIIILGSPVALTIVVALFAAGGIWEYNCMVLGKGFLKEKIESMFFAAVIPFVMLFGGSQMMLAVLALCILIVFILFLGSVKEADFDVITVAKIIFGLMYIPFLMSHFILLRNLEKGILWVFFVLVLALAGDITALYVGKYLGKHKLIPLISPGKTVEGTIGLILGSTVACLIFAYFSFPGVSLLKIGILAFIGSIIGQLGDLSESAIKRNYGLKDASSLLPGHGGLLDRMDCLLFIAPFVYYYRIYVID
ncbi:MAG: Phosphatidate cytidylyltransferase [Smithella sp. PtaU1.Bin162]|nr:MAG: Phosphatidate cytidylyltransferase [Smithella sp. PtaU1.Bin162]